FGTELAVAAPIEGPGATESAIPRTSARKLDRRAGIQGADEVLVVQGKQVASGSNAVEILKKLRRRSFTRGSDNTGEGVESRATASHLLQQQRCDPFSFTTDDAVYSTSRMLDNVSRNEGGAVAADENKALGESAPRLDREIEDFRNIGQIVQ